MLTRLERHQPVLWHLLLVGLLPCIAGAVNASGFFIVGQYTSHVTGSVGHFGDELAQGHFLSARIYLAIIGAFFVGAMCSTVLLRIARSHRDHAHFVFPLALEAIALFGVTWIGFIRGPQENLHGWVGLCLLSFSMGTQNAMVTSLSGARVRTTHITGITTDLGIDTVNVLARAFETLKQTKLAQVPRALLEVWFDQEFTRFRIHLGILASFATGAVVGPLLYLRIGMTSMLIPVIALSLLAAFDCLPHRLLLPKTAGGAGAPGIAPKL